MAKAPKKATSKTPMRGQVLPPPQPEPAPCGCCPDCVGKASGTMGECEDDTCRDIDPPAGTGPWVLYWHPNINQGFPYWEAVANVLAPPPVAQRDNRKPARKRVMKKG